MWIQKKTRLQLKENRNVNFCVAYSGFFYIYPSGDQQAKHYFILSYLRIRMSYHRLNNLAEVLNGNLAVKIGWGICSKYLMDRKCNCSLPSKFNGKCVDKGKFWYNCLIYQVKCSICYAIYLGIT